MSGAPPSFKGWTKMESRFITRQSFQEAVDRVLEEDVTQVRERTQRYIEFMDLVPEEHKTHPDILFMAAIVGEGIPLHPHDHERMMRRFEEITGG